MGGCDWASECKEPMIWSGGRGKKRPELTDPSCSFSKMDGWVSVFGQNANGTWVEVVKDQVQLMNPVHVLFL